MEVKKKQPRISINKLAEYLEATANRRKRIVKDQKTPFSPIVTRYQEADNAILRYILSNYDGDLINQAISELENKACTSEHQINDRDSSILLLEHIGDMELPDLSGYKLSLYDGINPKLIISGVEVSVRPEIIVRKGNRVGAIKIHRGKTFTLNEELLKCVAIVLHDFVKEHIADTDEVVDSSLCFAVDAFEKLFAYTPNAVTRRKERIATACEEIALWWDAV
jgi:hypothetical protein